jgi:hypothetical protein
MAQGSSKIATCTATILVPFVPSIRKPPAAAGTAIEMIISKRILKRMGVNPFSVFTDLKTVEGSLDLIRLRIFWLWR